MSAASDIVKSSKLNSLMNFLQTIIWTICFICVLVPCTDTVKMTVNFVGDPILGSSVQMVGTWISNSSDQLLSFTVTSESGKSYFLFILSPVQQINEGDYHSRLSVAFSAPPDRRFVMNISVLQCSDEETYVFTITYLDSKSDTLGDKAGVVLRVKGCLLEYLMPITSMVSYDKNGLVGTNATFICNWTSTTNLDSPNYLVVTSQDGTTYYEYNISTGSLHVNQTYDRIILNTSLLTNDSFAMTLTDLRCSDEQTFVCSLHYTDAAGNRKITTSTADLEIKIPPSSLELIDHTSTTTSVSATCRGNVGRTKKGFILWSVYNNNNNLMSNLIALDKVVNTAVPLLSSDEVCSHRIESTFSVQVNATFQHLVVTCFVFNTDFQPDINYSCGNQVSRWCQRTGAMHYAPTTTNFTVNGSHSIVLAPGRDVIFKCHVDGDPVAMTVLIGSRLGQVFEKTSKDQFLEWLLSDIQCEDSGRYECRGLNGLERNSTGQTKYVDVNVTCPPKLRTPSTAVQTYRFSPDIKTKFVIDVYGFPEPKEFVLRVLTTDLWTAVNDSKYSVTYVHLTPPFGQVNVTIFDEGTKSKTTYMLDIKNDVGVLNVTFDVIKEFPIGTVSEQPTVKERDVMIGVITSALGALLILSLVIACRVRQIRKRRTNRAQQSHA